MTVLADFTVPTRAFAIGTILDEHDDVAVEFEAVVPVGERAGALFWVRGDPSVPVEELESQAGVRSLTRLEASAGRSLYHGTFERAQGTIVSPLSNAAVSVLSGTGDGSGWQFRVLCRDRRSLSEFTERVTGQGVPVTLDRVSPYEDSRGESLSEKQVAAVLAAYDAGYFEVPRRTTVEDLAMGMGISDSAFSQRLRRGLRAVVAESVASGSLGQGASYSP